MAEVIRSRSVTSRGVMLGGSESGNEVRGGEGEKSSEKEAEGETLPE